MRLLARVIPVILAFLLLAVHFLRTGEFIAAAASLLAPLLLLFRERWSLIVVQVLAYVGAGIWLITAWSLVQQRLKLGLPWSRLAIILGAVILLTVGAGLLLNSTAVKERYPP